MGRFKVRGVHWNLHQKVSTSGQMPTPEMEGILATTFAVHHAMHELGLCTSFRHARVSESTIIEQEKEVMGKELDYEICIPGVVQWCMLWFSAPTRLNQTLGRNSKKQKYHEVVDLAITEAISRPLGSLLTQRERAC